MMLVVTAVFICLASPVFGNFTLWFTNDCLSSPVDLWVSSLREGDPQGKCFMETVSPGSTYGVTEDWDGKGVYRYCSLFHGRTYCSSPPTESRAESCYSCLQLGASIPCEWTSSLWTSLPCIRPEVPSFLAPAGAVVDFDGVQGHVQLPFEVMPEPPFTIEFSFLARSFPTVPVSSRGFHQRHIVSNIQCGGYAVFLEHPDQLVATAGTGVRNGNCNGPTNTYVKSFTKVGLNEWHYAAFQVGLTSFQLYVNGTKRIDTPLLGPYHPPTCCAFRNQLDCPPCTSGENQGYISLLLGGNPSDDGNVVSEFDGFIGNVRLSNGVRYSQPAYALQQLTVDNLTTAFYTGEASGSRLIDSSGNGHDGVIAPSAAVETWWGPPTATATTSSAPITTISSVPQFSSPFVVDTQSSRSSNDQSPLGDIAMSTMDGSFNVVHGTESSPLIESSGASSLPLIKQIDVTAPLLSPGSIIGIVAGSILCVALVTVTLFFGIRQHRQQQQEPTSMVSLGPRGGSRGTVRSRIHTPVSPRASASSGRSRSGSTGGRSRRTSGRTYAITAERAASSMQTATASSRRRRVSKQSVGGASSIPLPVVASSSVVSGASYDTGISLLPKLSYDEVSLIGYDDPPKKHDSPLILPAASELEADAIVDGNVYIMPPTKEELTRSMQNLVEEAHVDASWVISADEIKSKKKLSAGAYGLVWKAKWREIDVAVKEVKSFSPEDTKALLNDAQELSKLRPFLHVVPFYGVCVVPSLAVVLGFCSLGSLDAALYGKPGEQRHFSESELHGIILGCAKGVNHLHQESVIHRDLAARNVLLDVGLVAKVTDFGMSKSKPVVEGDGSNDDATTKTQFGPLKWMAPEQLNDSIVSKKSDVYSFGCLLYEIYKRETPWLGVNIHKAALSVMKGEQLDMPEEAPGPVREVMQKCWTFDRSERIDMQEVLRLLTEAFEGQY